MAASTLPHTRTQRSRAFLGRLSQSRFFTISVALHFVLVLGFGSVVLVKQVTPRADFDDSTGGLVAPVPPAPPDAIQPLDATTLPSSAARSATTPLNALSAILTPAARTTKFVLPSAPMNLPSNGTMLMPESSSGTPQTPQISGIPLTQAKKMASFANWRAANDTGQGVGKDRAFKFTAYLAKYDGGDWASTVHLSGDKITAGSLPNLLYIIRKWSRNKIDANPDAEPLDLSSDKLFTVKPPFIFFTGHRDFVLTDKEVSNLQQYLQLGGAIWGDSSLPGSRSRFDLAFRREMKRVLPDQNVTWETLPPDHAIFTQTYFPAISKVPPGLNYYQEPVYALKLYGEISVLYTANDYGDMWQIGLNERGDIDFTEDEHNNFVAINGTIYDNREVYFRNLEAPALNDSYKFGTNIILHLLTRWEDKLRNVPTGL